LPHIGKVNEFEGRRSKFVNKLLEVPQLPCLLCTDLLMYCLL